MKRTIIALGAAALLSLTACASGGTVADSSPSSSSRPSFSPRPLPSLSPSAGEPTTVTPERWATIVSFLQGLGVTSEPELVSAESVIWNDGSLGCAKPGVSYTQVMIDGMRVVVTADGKTYDLRFGRQDTPVLCTR